MVQWTRRSFLAAAAGAALQQARLLLALDANADRAPSPSLKDLIRHPLLTRSVYHLPVSRDYSEDGAAGTNRESYRWIEEQRQGAEWIVRGVALGRADWIELGWRELDWGLRQQKADGGFDSQDAFHSTSFFVEALGRSCLLDPAGANAQRTAGLARGARWLMSPAAEARGLSGNAPFTHRRYILAATFGEAARVTGEASFARRATAWAEEGIALQQADGTNPERGGFDVSYQMVGVLMALRYLPVCDDAELRQHLRAMIRKAVAPVLARLQPDGSIDAEGSTRVGKEKSRAGIVKTVAYGEVVQALVYGAQALPQPEWLVPAQQIVTYKRWDAIKATPSASRQQ
ncbi:MAG: hypothetical protein ABR905_00045 [Terracidiphilus sp.]|jgi:hypothetical protein